MGFTRLAKDLSAGVRQGRVQTSQLIPCPYNKYSQYYSYSLNEGRLVSVQPSFSEHLEEQFSHYDEDGNAIYFKDQLIDTLILSPLFNSRVLPQFNHCRFENPVAPLVDLERGFTSVFTLNLKPTVFDNVSYDVEIPGYIQSSVPLVGDFDHSVANGYSFFYNISPGLLIKFFNGLELTVPLKEKLIRCDRCTLSKDGFNIAVSGLILEPSSKNPDLIVPREAILLYQINNFDYTDLQLVDKIYFADEYVPKELDNIEERITLAPAEIEQYNMGEYEQAKYYSEFTYYSYRVGSTYPLESEEDRNR